VNISSFITKGVPVGSFSEWRDLHQHLRITKRGLRPKALDRVRLSPSMHDRIWHDWKGSHAKDERFSFSLLFKFNLMVKPLNSMTDAFLQLHDDPLGTISLYDGLPRGMGALAHQDADGRSYRRRIRIARGTGPTLAAGLAEVLHMLYGNTALYTQTRSFHASEIQ
jgi:hypothetical protein